jgi:hypothetical protein
LLHATHRAAGSDIRVRERRLLPSISCALAAVSY